MGPDGSREPARAGDAAGEKHGRPWDPAERATFLETVRLFRQLPPAVLRQVAERFRPRRIRRGEFAFLEGEPARSLNLLASGRIKVIRETEHGREVILRLIEPGEIFGAAGGWGDPRYPASAAALADAVILQIPSHEFTALLSTQPDFSLAVVRELGLRLREASERIQDLQAERAEQRLARALLRQAARSGQENPTGFQLLLSRQHLSELAGTTLSTASRVVSAWDREGVVAAGRERITLLQPSALRAIADDRT